MKNRIIKQLRCKKGTTYVDMVLLVLVSVMAIVLSLNIFSYLTLKQDLDYIATETVDAAAIHGIGGNDGSQEYRKVQSVFEQACTSSGYKVGNGTGEISLVLEAGKEGYFAGSKHVQLGDSIKVKVVCKTQLRALGALSNAISIDCTTEKISLSRVYWK